MLRKHIYLGNDIAETINYTRVSNGGNRGKLPDRNVAEHAAWLRRKYSESISSAEEKIRIRKEANTPYANGAYLDIDIKGGVLPLANLDTCGAHLLTVGEAQEEITKATIYLPFEKKRVAQQETG